MKKRILAIVLIAASLVTLSDNDIQKNKNRINQIETQIKNNNNKLNTNKSKINNAQRTEAQVKKEISSLNNLIYKLQKEYTVIENEYITLLKKIGKSEKEIKDSINKINQSNEKITIGKNEYDRKINTWNKVMNSNVFRKNNYTALSDKRQRDLIKILEVEEENIRNIEKYKSSVESYKKKTEDIKIKTEQEAKKVEKKKKELENKRAELRKAKGSKDKAVRELQYIQNKLKKENKNIESTNSKLISEKRRLEAQINAIIAAAAKRKKENEKSEKPVEQPKGTGKFMMPIPGKVVVSYGQEKAKGLTSKGIEIRGTLGQSVKASDSGVILYSGSLKGLGAVIMIDHGGFITVYGNLSSVKVANGAKVSKGQVIGILGRDSISKEPNLYFEVRKGVNYVNPLNYL